MEYQEAASLLSSLQTRRPKLGIDTTSKMLAQYGHPEEDVDCIQIAGSNGKGSTATMIERILREAGFSVGLFTSPALDGFRKQITVDGRPLPKRALREYGSDFQPILEELREEDDEPTHFEALTAVAIRHFAESDVDFAILEVGIGGQYDATSAVNPVASAVTSISLEHTELLGETRAEIARDKAHVAPKSRPLVTGATGTALEAIKDETEVISVSQSHAEADVTVTYGGLANETECLIQVTSGGSDLEAELQLLGEHQAQNAGVAVSVVDQLVDISDKDIKQGLRKTTLPGRFEIIDHDPIVILDGSHNPGACKTLESLTRHFEYDNLILVFGAMQDKDHKKMVNQLPHVNIGYATQPMVDRSENANKIADVLTDCAEVVYTQPNSGRATERALESAGENDMVLITGSFYLISEARDRWTQRIVPLSNNSESTTTSYKALRNEFSTVDTQTATQSFRLTVRPDQQEAIEQLTRDKGAVVRIIDEHSSSKSLTLLLQGTLLQLRRVAAQMESTGDGIQHIGSQLQAQLSDETHSQVPGIQEQRTAVMGILNVTPDSFYDGGEYNTVDLAVERAKEMTSAGADIIDIGGESTRPGADPVSIQEEIDRVVPVIERLQAENIPLSIDTRKAPVAAAALQAGADIVNDVSGLEDPDLPHVVAEHDAHLILMHSLSAPVDPSLTPRYDDVVDEVQNVLNERILRAQRAGISRDKIVIDPGLGFGKTSQQSFELVDRIHEFNSLCCPLLIGHSRKSMLKNVSSPESDRLPATVAVTTLVAHNGVEIVRVHDVEENAAAVRSAATQTR